ncbi:MAG: alpha/beta hydrolase [Bacteroidota bacterium]
MRSLFLSILFLLILAGSGSAQVETRWIDSSNYGDHDMGYFFTNRPLKNTSDSVVTFRNRWTRQTRNLYFCLYDYEEESIIIKYQANKTCFKREYPTEPVPDNIFYTVYEDLRLKRGIQNFIFVVPGYAKTFEKQLNDFMFRLDKTYEDTLHHKTAIIMFAWGDQSVSQFYHKGKRSANRAANDFAIFQHMLEDFVTDSAFFAEHPRDVAFSLVCTSMGNQMLKRYMIKREKQGIDLVPVYDRVIFIGSDAANDSFEEGKGFHNLTQMTDRVTILINRKDGPLTMSQYMNIKFRMGRVGPTNLDELPENVQVWDITGMINWEDLPAMGHDYLLRNSAIRDSLIHRELEFQEIKFQE